MFAGGDDALTEREIEVLAHAGKGETNAGIAKRLHISEATVKTHLKHIYAKLGVTDRAWRQWRSRSTATSSTAMLKIQRM